MAMQGVQGKAAHAALGGSGVPGRAQGISPPAHDRSHPAVRDTYNPLSLAIFDYLVGRYEA